MTAAPPSPVVLAGSRPGAAYFAALNTYLAFITNPPAASAYRSVLRTTADSIDDVLVMDIEDYDRSGVHATNSSEMRIPVDGRYEVLGVCRFVSNATGFRRLTMRLNAGASITGGSFLAGDDRGAVSGGPTTLQVSFSRVFNTGDKIEAFGFQNSGGALALDFGIRKCGIEVKWCGTT